MESVRSNEYRVWIDTKNRVASFSALEEGELVEFCNYAAYERYLMTLIEKHYLFQ